MEVTADRPGRFSRLGKELFQLTLRFPATVLFLVLWAIFQCISIRNDLGYWLENSSLICTMGAVSGILLTVLSERFSLSKLWTMILKAAPVLVAVLYALLIGVNSEQSLRSIITTEIVVAIMMTAVFLIPAIGKKYPFEQVFLLWFKNFWVTALFTLILLGGISLILLAIDRLIIRISSDAYSYSAIILFILFAPLYLLGSLPTFSADSTEESFARRARKNRFLEVLLSYIIIPLLALYALVLLVYLVMQLGQAAHAPEEVNGLILTFAYVGLLTHILVGTMHNGFTRIFRLVFPKAAAAFVLVALIVLLYNGILPQGITLQWYIIGLLGLFSLLCTGYLAFRVRANGVVPLLVIVFLLISIVPPVDYQSIPFYSQRQVLTSTLERNGMLKDNKIVPKADISIADQQRIRAAADFIYQQQYEKRVPYLPTYSNYSNNFEQTFGFYENPDVIAPDESKSYESSGDETISAAGYDYILPLEVYSSLENISETKTSGQYTLQIASNSTAMILSLYKDKALLASLSVDQTFVNSLAQYAQTEQGKFGNKIAPEHMVLEVHNAKADMKLVIHSITVSNVVHFTDLSLIGHVLYRVR